MLAAAVDSDGASTTSVKTAVGSTFCGDVLLTLRSGRRDFVGRAVTVTTAWYYSNLLVDVLFTKRILKQSDAIRVVCTLRQRQRGITLPVSRCR